MRPSLLSLASILASASARGGNSYIFSSRSSATTSAAAAFLSLSSAKLARSTARAETIKVKDFPEDGGMDNQTCLNSSAVGDFDPDYPGTAMKRLRAVRERVSQLTEADLNGRWVDVRRKLLWAGGLRDLSGARPGEGYTGHSFNDWNHVDLTCMNDGSSDNQNDGRVKGIAVGNFLGEGIRTASLPELGPGGSWSTCALGCNQDPPQDVAHLQFKARVAFKLVWVPNEKFDTFVLVDDGGDLLARGTPSDGPGGLPPLRERVQNYRIMEGSKYSRAADAIAGESK
mmetsp:Transcript_6392/g.17857  ORF Transcript_6392/g.17857 Transcript_6392/m.17857 type:complete len:286 (-) Transcript_6392:193-1050(-)|eukprot:CAMPEP_0181056484 /NCGR_PEP_ID=MMETSP1070-20121207/19748_1 /TAXON_ID=265543 /ORGANISM="Minutocellus polymorphus, Strain NH13" /LENGTH=285 /DNA_ID=CAMNT_0023135847 /DNA_START=42 /DNA_END=899 /DNA_ORIENTATION=+